MQPLQNTCMKKCFTIWMLCLLASIEVTAQVGSITGRVLNEKKEPITGAFIQVTQEGIKKLETTTDEEGNYILKSLQADRYDVTAKYDRYKTIKTTGVIVSPDKNTNLNYQMHPLPDTFIVQTTFKYACSFLEPEPRKTITAADIEKMPTRSIYSNAQPTISIDKASGQGHPTNKKKKKRKWLIF